MDLVVLPVRALASHVVLVPIPWLGLTLWGKCILKRGDISSLWALALSSSSADGLSLEMLPSEGRCSPPESLQKEQAGELTQPHVGGYGLRAQASLGPDDSCKPSPPRQGEPQTAGRESQSPGSCTTQGASPTAQVAEPPPQGVDLSTDMQGEAPRPLFPSPHDLPERSVSHLAISHACELEGENFCILCHPNSEPQAEGGTVNTHPPTSVTVEWRRE